MGDTRGQATAEGDEMSALFIIVPVRPPVFLTDDQFQRIIVDYIQSLEGLGGAPGSEDDLERPEPTFFLVATGGTEEEILRLDAERRKVAPDDPVFLVAHPSSNSLPAALEVLARLQQNGRPGRIFYLGGPDDTPGLMQVHDAARDLAVLHALRQKRIGLIGPPSDWLVASSPGPVTLRRVWGPQVVEIAMDELTESLTGASQELVESEVALLLADARDVGEPSGPEQEAVARVLAAIEILVDRYDLDALSIRCFDLVLEQKTTGCLALARLNDQGVIAGCEGDLVSTMAMLWTHELLQETPWMANPARLDEARNTLWLAHCTVPLSLVSGFSLRSHFESGLGVAIQGDLPRGPVTLLRIGGAGIDRLWLAEGEIIGMGDSEKLCRTQVEIQLADGCVGDLLRSPLGNHLVMVRGHHAGRLRSWWETILQPAARAGGSWQ